MPTANKLMKRQWDGIADENAFYGVLSRDEFENPDDLDVDKFWETGRADVDSILKIAGLGDTSSMSLLEIGCGIGRMTNHFAQCFREVRALDVSTEMLTRAESYWKHLKNVDWVLGNGEDLGVVGDASVDCVVSFWVLQHIPNQEGVIGYIRESEKVLKKGGTAFLQFRMAPHALSLSVIKYGIVKRLPPSLHTSLAAVWDRINGFDGTRAKFARQYSAWRGCVVTPQIIEKTAAEAGLRIQSKGSFGRQSSGTQSAYYVFRKS